MTTYKDAWATHAWAAVLAGGSVSLSIAQVSVMPVVIMVAGVAVAVVVFLILRGTPDITDLGLVELAAVCFCGVIAFITGIVLPLWGAFIVFWVASALLLRLITTINHMIPP